MNGKRICGILLVLTLLCSIGVQAAFSDLPETHWASSTIEQLTEDSVITGYPDGTFRPEDSLTRAEFLAVVIRACWPELAVQPAEDADWWEPYYAVATDKQLLLRGDNTILAQSTAADMRQTISRYEVATILGHIPVQSVAHQVVLNDRETFPTADAGAIASVVESGLMEGYPDGCFHGEKGLTRAEGATILQRLLAYRKINQCVVTRNASVFVTETQTKNSVVLQSHRLADQTLLQSVTVPTETQSMTPDEASATENWAVLGVDGSDFWGTAGYYSCDQEGNITCLLGQPVYAATRAQNGTVVVVAGETGVFHSYIGGAVWNPCGDRVLQIAPDGAVTTLLSAEPAHGLNLTQVTSAELGDIRVQHAFVMGIADWHLYEYAIENGKLRALEHEPGRGYSGYTAEEAAAEQARLDAAGCGIGSNS